MCVCVCGEGVPASLRSWTAAVPGSPLPGSSVWKGQAKNSKLVVPPALPTPPSNTAAVCSRWLPPHTAQRGGCWGTEASEGGRGVDKTLPCALRTLCLQFGLGSC